MKRDKKKSPCLGKTWGPSKREQKKRLFENSIQMLEGDESIHRKAMNYGLDVRWTVAEPKGVHVMFTTRNGIVLNWWPTTGTTIDANRIRRQVEDVDEALALANSLQGLLGEVIPDDCKNY